MDGHDRTHRRDALRLVPRATFLTSVAPGSTFAYTDTGLTQSTGYSYTVTAFDAAGNSTASDALSVTTNATPDTTAPIKPATRHW